MRPGDQPTSSGLLHHDAHTPSQGGGLYHDPEPSRSRVYAVFFEEMPHFIEFEDDRLSAGRRLFSVVRGILANPGQDRAGPHPEHLRQGVHRDAVTVEKDGQRFLPQWSPTRRDARKLIATAPTEPALFASGLPSLDHVRMCAFRTGVHASLPIAVSTMNTIGKNSRISLLRQYSLPDDFCPRASSFAGKSPFARLRPLRA